MNHCSVLLVKPSARREQPVLPRSLEQALQQRAAVVAGFSAGDETWRARADETRSRLIADGQRPQGDDSG